MPATNCAFDFGTSVLENATVWLTFSLIYAKSRILYILMRRVGLRKGYQLLASELVTLIKLKNMLASHEQNPRISALGKSRRRANQTDRTGLPAILEHNLDVYFLTRRRCVSTRRKASDRNNQQREGNMNGSEKGTLERCLNTRKKTRFTKRKNQPLWRINL